MTKEQHVIPMILIVEDHPATLQAVRELVSARFPAYRVVGAASAEAALEHCANDAPFVVIMDISLPGMDGVEATRRIKALRPQACIVMHSSHDLPIFRSAATLAGASAFVPKSATFSDLVPTIAARMNDLDAPDRSVKGS